MRSLATLAVLAVALALPRVAAGAPSGRPGQLIEDDYERARAEAKKRGVPLVVDVWAPW